METIQTIKTIHLLKKQIKKRNKFKFCFKKTLFSSKNQIFFEAKERLYKDQMENKQSKDLFKIKNHKKKNFKNS